MTHIQRSNSSRSSDQNDDGFFTISIEDLPTDVGDRISYYSIPDKDDENAVIDGVSLSSMKINGVLTNELAVITKEITSLPEIASSEETHTLSDNLPSTGWCGSWCAGSKPEPKRKFSIKKFPRDKTLRLSPV